MNDTGSRKGESVLVGIDFLESSAEVLAKAVSLAASPTSDLHLVHVLPGVVADAVGGAGALRAVNLTEEVRAKLEGLAKHVPGSVGRVGLHVRMGNADVEIAQLASDLAADFVVIGTHNHSTLERLLIGSVAESLVRHAPCPVLTCRPKTVPRWQQIEPPCPDCLAAQQSTARSRLWCDRHAQHHPRAHTYSELPETFGIGSQTFR